MVFTMLRRKPVNKQRLIDTQEAFNLWSTLKSKNLIVERLENWENYAHDKDLLFILKTNVKELKENTNIIKNLMEKFAVSGPTQENRFAVKTPINSESIQDRFIANDLFLYMQGHVEDMLSILRTTNTNDSLRSTLQKMIIKTINQLDQIIHYLKLKGWIETPPLYHDIPANITDKLSTAEAYHLWDNLGYRYDNIRQTKIYLSYAFDGDFKVVINMGIEQLKKHANVFEKELKYFGIPLPKKPSSIISPPENTELLDDQHMYRIILIGIQGTTVLHAQALKHSTFNDRIRNIFKKMLLEEIGFLDRIIKFGKAKGWLNPVPSYRA